MYNNIFGWRPVKNIVVVKPYIENDINSNKEIIKLEICSSLIIINNNINGEIRLIMK